jgi:transposase InsO family protein
MVFRLLARYKQDPRFSVLLPRRQGRKRGSHVLLEGQERMISLQIQALAGTEENPSLAALHRKIAAACRKRRLPIPSYGTVLRRLRAYDARTSRRKLERPARSQSTVQRKMRNENAKVYALTENDNGDCYIEQPVFDSSRSGLPGHPVPHRARETQWQPPVAMLYISVPNPFCPPTQ